MTTADLGGYPLTITEGQQLNAQLPFLAHSVYVTNNSGQWLKIGNGHDFVRPNQVGQMIPLPGVGFAVASWEAPPGQSQPAGVAQQKAVLRYYADVLTPDSGAAIGLELDTNAADVQPLAPAAVPGGIGLAADAGHRHPFAFFVDATWPDYGAVAGAVCDVAIQKALNAMHGTQVGGRVVLPRATDANGNWLPYLINNPLVIPARVQLVGDGRDSTMLRPGPLFPAGQPMVKLGDPTLSGFCFATRLEDLTLDCNNVAAGVDMFQLQEQSGIFRVLAYRWVGFAYREQVGMGNQNHDLRDLEAVGDTGIAAGSATDVALDIDGTNQGSPRAISGVSLVCIAGHEPAALAKLDAIDCAIEHIHLEHATDGILLASRHAVTGVLVYDVNSGPGITNAVHVSAAIGGSNAYAVMSVKAGGTGSTNYLKDDLQGITIAETIGFYAVGGGAHGSESILSTMSGVGSRFRPTLSSWSQLYPGHSGTGYQASGGILHHPGVPANTEGNNNDWCISDNGHVYFKAGGVWGRVVTDANNTGHTHSHNHGAHSHNHSHDLGNHTHTDFYGTNQTGPASAGTAHTHSYNDPSQIGAGSNVTSGPSVNATSVDATATVPATDATGESNTHTHTE